MFRGFLAIALWTLAVPVLASESPLGGFVPFVGVGLTDEYDTLLTDPEGTFFIADASTQWGGSPLGPGSSAFFDVAILDTGAAAHILTQTAASAAGFGIQQEGFQGTMFQEIFGPTGNPVQLRINDPLGVYVAGLKPGPRTSPSGASLTMDTNLMRGQTSVSMLEGDANWALPNIIGLPMAAQHSIVIHNDLPQVFQYQGRTLRTPQVDVIDRGTGGQQGIVRRTNLRLRPSASFISGPLYVQNLTDIFNGEDNPTSPTVVDSGGLYVDVDLANNGLSAQNVEFLFDTGADLTVVSEVMAASLGFDVAYDEPDFVLQVEGGGGVRTGVPGFYLDELKIDAVGGSLVLHDVPIAVLDAPNPADPANVIDAILGMSVFTGRNLVVDTAPAALGLGSNPYLYISDPVTQSHTWSTDASSADWSAAASWGDPNGPGKLWAAQVENVSGSNQSAVVSSNSTVYNLTVAGTPTAKMSVDVQSGATLTTFGETRIDEGGEVHIDGGKLDSQFVNIYGGELTGHGEVFVGTGPLNGVVRNLSGRVAPDGEISITGDLSNLTAGTIAIDLFTSGNDSLDVSRSAYLSGTLEVSLDGGFMPTLNQVFTILAYGGSIDLDFDQILFPAGFQWDLSVNALAKSVELEVTGIGDIAGDFNHDGSVDKDDLALWEAGYGQPGGYTGDDFLVWQRNVGAGGLAVSTSVPEPAASLLAALCLALGMAVARRRC